jgi:hypothetical protein
MKLELHARTTHWQVEDFAVAVELPHIRTAAALHKRTHVRFVRAPTAITGRVLLAHTRNWMICLKQAKAVVGQIAEAEAVCLSL